MVSSVSCGTFERGERTDVTLLMINTIVFTLRKSSALARVLGCLSRHFPEKVPYWKSIVEDPSMLEWWFGFCHFDHIADEKIWKDHSLP